VKVSFRARSRSRSDPDSDQSRSPRCDENAPLWRVPVPSRFLLEARLGGAFGPTFGGDVGGCSECSKSPVFGGVARASLGFELGVGLGFTVDGGYAWTRQHIEDLSMGLRAYPALHVSAQDDQRRAGIRLAREPEVVRLNVHREVSPAKVSPFAPPIRTMSTIGAHGLGRS
jgi:hypothetical protein